MNDQQSQYNLDQAEFSAFRVYYEEQHPNALPSIELFKPRYVGHKPVESDYKPSLSYPKHLQKIVFLMFVCAALLSGVHTIPTVYEGIQVTPIITETIRTIASISSFVAIELSLLISAYMLVTKSKVAVGVLIVGFLVAMISNIYSVSKAMGSQDVFVIIVSLIIGVGMPIIALLAGKMLINMTESEKGAQLEAYNRFKSELEAYEQRAMTALSTSQEQYRNALIKFDDEVLQAYMTYKRRSSTRVRVSKEQGASLPAPKRTSTGSKRDIVLAFLQENPNAINSTVREIEALLGGQVSRGLINNVMQELRAGGSNE